MTAAVREEAATPPAVVKLAAASARSGPEGSATKLCKGTSSPSSSEEEGPFPWESGGTGTETEEIGTTTGELPSGGGTAATAAEICPSTNTIPISTRQENISCRNANMGKACSYNVSSTKA